MSLLIVPLAEPDQMGCDLQMVIHDNKSQVFSVVPSSKEVETRWIDKQYAEEFQLVALLVQETQYIFPSKQPRRYSTALSKLGNWSRGGFKLSGLVFAVLHSIGLFTFLG